MASALAKPWRAISQRWYRPNNSKPNNHGSQWVLISAQRLL